MATPVEFYVEVGTLPANFQGTWAEFVAQLADLLSVRPDSDWSSFTVGNTKPTSDVGPWLKTSSTGAEWWVWSSTAADYVPLTVSLPTISANSIDGAVLIDGTVTASKIDPAYTAGLGIGALSASVDALANQVSTGVGQLAVATKNASQSVTYGVGGGTAVKVSYGTELTDTSGRYDPTNSRYAAANAGWYWVTASLRTDTLSNTSPMGIGSSMQLRVNGSVVVNTDLASPDLDVQGRTLQVSGTVYLAANDYVEIFFAGNLVSGALTAQLTNDGSKSRFQCWKVA